MTCKGCADGEGFPLAISMAFQPIVDLRSGRIFAQEALVRGAAGEGAGTILAAVSDSSRYAFDQACRVKAIDMAADLRIAETGAALSINFLPNAVYEPKACIRATLGAAMRRGFPLGAIIFEFTEAERLDVAHLLNILTAYKAMGFRTAIDDFGAGWSGLGLLSRFTPDIVKLDMELIRDIDSRPEARIIVGNILHMLRELGVTPVCEGIETEGEYEVLRGLGVDLMQGYYFAKPRFEGLADVKMPGTSLAA